jgi:hypothetical protein
VPWISTRSMFWLLREITPSRMAWTWVCGFSSGFKVVWERVKEPELRMGKKFGK